LEELNSGIEKLKEAGHKSTAGIVEGAKRELHVSGDLNALPPYLEQLALQLKTEGHAELSGILKRVRMKVVLAAQLQMQYKVIHDVVDLFDFEETLLKRGLEKELKEIAQLREDSLYLDADLEHLAEKCARLGARLRKLGDPTPDRTSELEGEAMEMERMAMGLKAVLKANLAASKRDNFISQNLLLIESAIEYYRDRFLYMMPESPKLEAAYDTVKDKPPSAEKDAILHDLNIHKQTITRSIEDARVLEALKAWYINGAEPAKPTGEPEDIKCSGTKLATLLKRLKPTRISRRDSVASNAVGKAVEVDESEEKLRAEREAKQLKEKKAAHEVVTQLLNRQAELPQIKVSVTPYSDPGS